MNSQSPKKILLLDDEADVREVAKLMLQTDGYVIVETDDGEEALQIISKGDIDLVLVDLQMPIMPGNIFLERMGSLSCPPPACLVVTGRNVKNAFAEFGDDIKKYSRVAKPFLISELLGAVREILHSS